MSLVMDGQDRFIQMIFYCLMHYCRAFDEKAASDLKMLDLKMIYLGLIHTKPELSLSNLLFSRSSVNTALSQEISAYTQNH